MNVSQFNQKTYMKLNKLFNLELQIILFNLLMDKYQEYISKKIYVKKQKSINVKILVIIKKFFSLINIIKVII